MHYSVNGKKAKKVKTQAYEGGERYYTEPGVFYRRVRGTVTGTKPGDKVEVWFAAGGKKSDPFSYEAEVESDNLCWCCPTRTTPAFSPTRARGRTEVPGSYTAALDAAGVEYDVYDVDAHGRRPPDPLGVLSHYSHVVWYTGDDYVPREPDAPGRLGHHQGRGRDPERRARLPQ